MSSGIMTSAPCVRLAPATGATTFRSRVVITTGHTFLSGLLYHPYNLYKVRLTTAFPHFSEPRSVYRSCLSQVFQNNENYLFHSRCLRAPSPHWCCRPPCKPTNSHLSPQLQENSPILNTILFLRRAASGESSRNERSRCRHVEARNC